MRYSARCHHNTVRYNAQEKTMPHDSFKTHIAQHLKALRQQQGLSLDAAAKQTGISKAMLGQIEREESSPTIATLWKIASGLQTSFSAFFAEAAQQYGQEWAFPDDENMKVKTLFSFQADTGLEMFEITLHDFHQQMSTPHSTGVVEYVYVLQGELQVFFEQSWHVLTTGDSVRFFADQIHGYEALSEKTVFHNTICYP